MNSLTYKVLSGDTVVAEWKNERLTVIDESLLPLYLKRNPNADQWLASRAIDHRRPNARLRDY